MRLVIVSGLSGSGKSVALHLLEDVGFYCMDNVPAALLDSVITQIAGTGDPFYENLAVGVDVRSRASDLESLPDVIRRFRQLGIRCEIVFLHADEDSLLKRYAESRRPHPLSSKGVSLREAIARERELLGPIMAAAELIIDTSQTSIYQLRDAVRGRVGLRAEPGLSILIESFGYKHGIPLDADLVFDVRFLRNPYYEPGLKGLSGRDPEVAAFIEQDPAFTGFFAALTALLAPLLPRYEREGKSYLTLAVGCTGGRHRSVYVAEKLAAWLRRQGRLVGLRHRDLGLDSLAG